MSAQTDMEERTSEVVGPAMFNGQERPVVGSGLGPAVWLSVKDRTTGKTVEAIEVMVRDLPGQPEILKRIPPHWRERLLLEVAAEANAPAECRAAKSPVGGPAVFQVAPGTPRAAVFTFTGCALESVASKLEDGIQGGLNATECFAMAQLIRQVEAALSSVGAVE